MKKLSEVLVNLVNKPEFNGHMGIQVEIGKLTDALPKSLSKGIAFGYVKNKILFFALKHPVFKTEFEYNRSMFTSLLKKYNVMGATNVEFFVTNKMVKPKKSEEIKFVDVFTEKSYGIFENKISDQKLHEKFEGIRNAIKTNREN